MTKRARILRNALAGLFVLAVIPAQAAPTAAALAAVPTPNVEGPIAQSPLSDPNKNYTFFQSDVALAPRGYTEQEFFYSGTANEYDAPLPTPAVPPSTVANIVSSGNTYKTRLIVRRPTDPAKFNGTVIVEWSNVTDGFDGEYFWAQSKDYLLRAGFAWVGVSAQNNAISAPNTGLKRFSPARYGSIDVTNGGKIERDNLSYDIFSQGVKAVRTVPSIMGGLAVKRVIAAGMSQSGTRFGTYANYIVPRANILDAMFFQVPGGGTQTIRADIGIPIFKVMTETEASAGNLANAQPDTATVHTWWVAGANHGDANHRIYRTGMQMRDIGWSVGVDSCGPNGATTTRSRIPFRHVVSAAVYQLERQIETGAVPPSGPAFTSGANGEAARDANGNAMGGIRLANEEVPVATASGRDCANNGVWIPFDRAKLASLYPSHADYVAKVARAAEASVKAGFVLPEDAATTITDAKASIYGMNLECGPLCLSVRHFTPTLSSTGLLREHTAYYNTLGGASLLTAVDEAHLATARGYTASGAKAKAQFARAVAALKRYVSLIDRARAEGRMTATAAGVLSGEADTIIKGLLAL